jgi:hypothetical protein
MSAAMSVAARLSSSPHMSTAKQAAGLVVPEIDVWITSSVLNLCNRTVCGAQHL